MAGHTAFQLYSINLCYTHTHTYVHTYLRTHIHTYAIFVVTSINCTQSHDYSIGTAGSHVSHIIGAGLQHQVLNQKPTAPLITIYVPYNTMQL